MKTYSFFFLIFIFLLSACAPQNVATPSPTPVFTKTPLPTTTPEPTQTLEPTATLFPAAEVSLDSCSQIIEAKISSAGVPEVVYASNDSPSITVSKFWFGQGTAHTGLWLWSGDTQAAIHFALPKDALGPKLSVDRHWIVFRRDPAATQSELWVIDASGQNEKKLATIPFNESSGLDATLNYDWVPNTNKIYYFIVLIGGDGATPDTFVLVDVDSGRAIPLADSREASSLIFSPDGSQAAVLTASELRLVDTKDGKVQFMLPMALSSYGVDRSSTPAYSPDGKYVIDFTEDSIVRVNTANGQSQMIPLKYSVIVPAGGDSLPSLSPDFTWAGSSTLLLPILNSDHHRVVLSPDGDPNMTFTVWQVDLNDGTAHQTQTFTGFQPSVVFSPDGNQLAFQKFQGVAPSQTMQLFLADLATGEILETIEGGVFEAWSPDSNEYIYSTGHPKSKGEADHAQYYLGQVGGKPILMDESVLDVVAWLDAEWIVTNCQIIHIP